MGPRNYPFFLKALNDLGTHPLHDLPHLLPQFSLELLKTKVAQVVEQSHMQEAYLPPLAAEAVKTVDEEVGIADFYCQKSKGPQQPILAKSKGPQERVHQDRGRNVGERHQGCRKEHSIATHQLVAVLLGCASDFPVAPLRLHHVVDELGCRAPQQQSGNHLRPYILTATAQKAALQNPETIITQMLRVSVVSMEFLTEILWSFRKSENYTSLE